MTMTPPAGYAMAVMPNIAPKLWPPNTSEKVAERMAIVAPMPRP